MIEFATFFLGLVSGAHNLDLVAGPDVARVEIRLDGRMLEELRGPWRTVVDFGPGLWPHDLLAVAYDAKSREVGRARQWINRPRAQAEAAIFLEGGAGGHGRRARVTWHSISGPLPKKWAVTFDGKPLVVASPREFELPPHVPEQVHFLRVELDFTENVSTVAEVVFGGRNKDETLSELTAVPILLTGKKLPPLAALEGSFVDGVEKLHVVAAEEGPAEVVFVLDGSADAAILAMGSTPRRASGVTEEDGVFRRDQRFRILWPVPETREHSGMRHEVFPSSEDLTAADGGVLSLLNGVRRYVSPADQKLSDAVAVAGVSATGRNRRRAVVLILGPEPKDRSDLPASEARFYLERLGVPFAAWSVVGGATPPGAAAWGVSTDISSRHLFARAVSGLSDRLERQRIVWVEGRHLAHRIEVAGKQPFVTLARGLEAPPGPRPEARLGAPGPTPAVAVGVAGEEVLIPAGSRLRTEPDSLAITLAVVDDDLALPVLERRGKWAMVRYESWKGWVEPGSDAGPATASAPVPEDQQEGDGTAEELRGARLLMTRASTRFHELLAGRLDLLTDVMNPASVSDLTGVARRFAGAFGDRYGIAMGAKLKWRVALFESEGACSTFRGPELEGPELRHIVVVFRGGQTSEEVRRETARDMARVAVRAKITSSPPPWLMEGIAADLAEKESSDKGAALRLVRAASRGGALPAAADLLALRPKAFYLASARGRNTALSGLIVRFFLDADGGRRAASFREFLDAVCHGDAPRTDWLLSRLGTDAAGLEKSFGAWLEAAK